MSHSSRDAFAAMRHPGYRRFLTGNFLFNVGRQGVSVAVAWQIYRWTNSATALGLIGLTEVLPLLALVIPAGALADRFDRRRILIRTTAVSGVLSLALLACTGFADRLPSLAPLRLGNALLHAIALQFEHHVDPATLHFDQPALPLVFLIVFLQAVARVTGNPARAALVPRLVPAATVSNAVTWSASAFELSSVIGPALGGGLVAVAGYGSVYFIDLVFSIFLVGALLGVHLFHETTAAPVAADRPPDALAGVRFIWRNQAILAAISLDLFAVLLGGSVALLPLYADRILHVGPAGLGWLRAAPSFGAITMAFVITHLPPAKRPGSLMLWTVAGFGTCIVVFSLSTRLWLSLFALYLSGVCDNFSVVVRHTLVQMKTPDSLRGRVSAVNQLFIGSSNQISELRAGLTAALWGPVVAATAGGIGTILVVGLVALVMPQLRAVPPLNTLRPEKG